MAAPWNTAGHYIFVLWFLLSPSSFCVSSPILSSGRLALPMWSAILLHMMRPTLRRIYNAGLKCGARGSRKIGTQKSQKMCHLRTIAQICRAVSSQINHASTIGKKNLLNSNISSTCHHNMNFDRLGNANFLR